MKVKERLTDYEACIEGNDMTKAYRDKHLLDVTDPQEPPYGEDVDWWKDQDEEFMDSLETAPF